MTDGVGMSSCCLSGAVHEGKPTGRVDQIGGLQTYIAEPKTGSKEKTVVIISDSELLSCLLYIYFHMCK